MAKCDVCDKPIGFWASRCLDCTQSQQREKRAELARAKAQMSQSARQRLEPLRDEAIINKASHLLDRIQAGESIQLIESVYVPVDSMIEQRPAAPDFDISRLIRFGYTGWSIAAVVPKTVGLALTNVTYGTAGGGETWGAGLGGNIVGVYVLLSRTINSETTDLDAVVRSYIRNHLDAFLDDAEYERFMDMAEQV